MRYLKVILPLILIVSCGKNQEQLPGETEVPPFEYDVTYKVDDSNFCNPERGLYVPTIKYFRNGGTPIQTSVEGIRNIRKSGKTFTYSEFYVIDYVYKDFDDALLDFVRETFRVHREGGAKTIVRFAYSDGMSAKHKPWDAPLEQTLRHVEQLKPIFEEFADVIYVVQYGFVGSWGEGYYTDNYGMNPRSDEDFYSRRVLMNALLDAVPESRQIAVRYPQYKRGILGISQGDTITSATAFGSSAIARVAGFNDCFVSAADDVGTYKSPYDREQWATETNYVSMGGETCRDPQNYCNCGSTLYNLRRYHWTYLNEAYNKDTHAVWSKGGCYDYIVSHLGYRFVLKGAAFGGDFKAGGQLDVKLHIQNEGFASIINKRPMQWVIVNASNPDEKYVIPSPKDPREWKGSQTYVYEESLKLPGGLKAGQKYKIALELPDDAPTLAGNPDFSIRFANEGVWEENTGLNILTTLTAE